MSLSEVSSNRCFGGYQKVFSHESKELKCKMNFAVYLPPQAENEDEKLPVVYWLSGLTCTEQNFIQKAGAQRYASELGIIIVGPDTSPRGCNIPGEDDSWDFGSGAGFYVDASVDPWKSNYRMYSYVTEELPGIIEESFPADPSRKSIMGHSMGGHGALICALKNPGKYCSVSAFAPICHPTQCPWGKKAFAGYFGPANEGDLDKAWEEWDATCLVANYSGPPLDILIHQGKEDQFLKDSQLLPDKFVSACSHGKVPVVLHMCEGYDHSYYFIASFIGQHLAHHAKYLSS
ncbi:S-formylglutathione hydrolase [Hetaerina americana]|uniref:S-formylglutathione hydrolase n=1 Tax=Hetaerina americana TaxID=62018 RepID=UPI003A7F3EFD